MLFKIWPAVVEPTKPVFCQPTNTGKWLAFADTTDFGFEYYICLKLSSTYYVHMKTKKIWIIVNYLWFPYQMSKVLYFKVSIWVPSKTIRNVTPRAPTKNAWQTIIGVYDYQKRGTLIFRKLNVLFVRLKGNSFFSETLFWSQKVIN